jgi:long-chain acyl-CoA synthetase
MDAVLGREPSEEEKLWLKGGVFTRAVALFLRAVVKLFFKMFFGIQVRGAENLPPPPFIIAANHSSYLDGFVIGTSVPADVFKSLYMLGIQRYFRGRFTSLFARVVHVIAIDPEVHLDKALELSSYVLREGNCLCIFPEGGRSFDGKPMEFKKGIGILALKLDVPVLPARIDGTFGILPRGAMRPRAGRIKLTFGRPLSLDPSLKPEEVDEYQFLANELRKRVIDL